MENSSKLIFGCSGIAKLGKKNALCLLESARDLGLYKYDVAPLYGYGIAEEYLGKFILNKRQSIILTTKAGIGFNKLYPSFYRIHRMLLSLSNDAVKNLSKNVVSGSNTLWRTNFDVNFIEKSVNSSLKRLRTDYIDCLLLHEAQYLQYTNGDLIRLLQKLKADGKVLKFGIGGLHSNLVEPYDIDDIYEVIQFNSGYNFSNLKILSPLMSARELNVFGIYNENLNLKSESIIRANNLICDSNYNRVAILLYVAILHGSSGVLFSTINLSNLKRNVLDYIKLGDMQ
jgi:hypothetical protein